MSAEWIPVAMFATLVVALLIGFPVAFSLAAVAGAFAVVGLANGAFAPAFLHGVQNSWCI